MSPKEQQAINVWFDATQQTQPPDSIALLLYVRDGNVILGRGGVAVEMKEFDLNNLPQVLELVNEAVNTLYERGISDGSGE